MSDYGAEGTYQGVMPLVACRSHGGHYEDQAFVAGAAFGRINESLSHSTEDTIVRYAPPNLVRQLDLAAMWHGWTMTSEPWDEHPDEWTLLRFTRQTGEF